MRQQKQKNIQREKSRDQKMVNWIFDSEDEEYVDAFLQKRDNEKFEKIYDEIYSAYCDNGFEYERLLEKWNPNTDPRFLS